MKMPSFFRSSKPAAAPIAPSNTSNGPIKSSDVIQASTAVAAITTLGSIATDYLANPAAITTITGLVGISSFATGGAVVVTLLVLAAGWRVLKEKQKAYKGLILVMDELYLVVQKLNGIVEISMFIAATYGFPVDTRDVQLALDAILAKFDELLDPTTDYKTIKEELSDFNTLRSKFNAQESQVKEELANTNEGDDAGDNPNISLWASVKYKVSNSSAVKFVKKNIMFSAPKFVQELNEAVTYLALYVGIFSASFSTTYTTVALQLLVNDKKDDLKRLQAMVFTNSKFISMIEGAFVYPLLQSKKTYETCMVKTDSNNAKCDAIFYNTAENVRKGMEKSFNAQNVVTGDLFNKMTELNSVTRSQTEIKTAADASKFADAVKTAFATDKAANAQSVPSVPPSVPTSAASAANNEATSAPSAPSVTNAPVQSVPSATSATSATPPSTTSAASAANDEATSEPSTTSATSATSESVQSVPPSVPTSAPSATSEPSVTSEPSATPLSTTSVTSVPTNVPSAPAAPVVSAVSAAPAPAHLVPGAPVMPTSNQFANDEEYNTAYADYEVKQKKWLAEQTKQRRAAYAQTQAQTQAQAQKLQPDKMRTGTEIPIHAIDPDTRRGVFGFGGSRTMRRGVHKHRHNTHSITTKSKN